MAVTVLRVNLDVGNCKAAGRLNFGHNVGNTERVK